MNLTYAAQLGGSITLIGSSNTLGGAVRRVRLCHENVRHLPPWCPCGPHHHGRMHDPEPDTAAAVRGGEEGEEFGVDGGHSEVGGERQPEVVSGGGGVGGGGGWGGGFRCGGGVG